MDDALRDESAWLRRARRRSEELAGRLGGLIKPPYDGPFDVQKFIEGLKIINKRGELVSLIMNRPQETVFHKILESREKMRPGRFICLKARQLGISTLIEAVVFALVTHYPNRFGLVVANSIESAQRIFSMARRFHRHMAGRKAAPLSRSNTRAIEYPPPHYSRLQIDTAANKNLGRGGTIHYVHASEAAFWEKPEEPVLAIGQSVPLHWDTLVFWESTANGIHNLFHRTWVAAERGESDLEPIFLSWKGFPEYSLPAAPREALSLTADEKDYMRRYALTREESKWARYTRINQCHNSWDRFHQEYPVSSHLAFVFTGRPWFDPEAVQDMLENIAADPIAEGYLRLAGENPAAPEFIDQQKGPLMIWKRPEAARSYSLGMDVGEGVGGDYTVIQVILNETGEVAAAYRSNRVRPETAGLDAYLLAAWYNFGLLGIERNGPGLAALAVCEHGMAEYPFLRSYPNLYYHTYTDRKTPEETRRLGWITNKATKEAMLSRLARTFESGALKIYSRTALLEMQGFVWDAERKKFRQNYRSPDSRLTHDDEIMALAIANEMRAGNWENRFISAKLPSQGEF